MGTDIKVPLGRYGLSGKIHFYSDGMNRKIIILKGQIKKTVKQNVFLWQLSQRKPHKVLYRLKRYDSSTQKIQNAKI